MRRVRTSTSTRGLCLPPLATPEEGRTMNGLEVLIIPLIALAVWVLQYLFRGPDENKPPNRARSGQARPGNRPPQRRPVTDLDRYLEETRRRRQDEGRPVVVAEVVPEPRG